MRLWGRINSINVQKVVWALGELELEYARIDAGGARGVTDTPEFLALNPMGRIPVLEDGALVLSESNAIVRYLCREYGGGELYPRNPTDLARAEQWMDWQATMFWPAMHPVFHGLIRKRNADRNEASIQSGVEQTERCLGILNMYLASNAYVSGGRFGMADIPVGVTVSRWKKLPLQTIRHDNVDRWFDVVRCREAFSNNVDIPLS